MTNTGAGGLTKAIRAFFVAYWVWFKPIYHFFSLFLQSKETT